MLKVDATSSGFTGALIFALVSWTPAAAQEPQNTDVVALANCGNTSTGMIPLIDLGAGAYQGFEGGLYPGGGNTPPEPYFSEGMRAASRIVPRDWVGQFDPNGKIVVLSIGMSNTTQEFSEFKREADPDLVKNTRLVIVDGAQGGQDAEIVKDPNAAFWTIVAQRLQGASATSSQVQVVWLKEAIASPRETFPLDARRLQADLQQIVLVLALKFPNLQIVYLSSRTYAGYASTQLNPEPYAYQSGFAVKWLITDRMNHVFDSPWLAWGPYLWTDGTRGRSDGFIWECKDTQSDGTHPSPTSGVQKVAGLLREFFESNPTAQGWYLGWTTPGVQRGVRRRLGGGGRTDGYSQ